MKKRSVTAVITALVMSVVAVFALIGCGNGNDTHPDDNSFVGCVSAVSFDTEEAAARGFLELELDGSAKTTAFVAMRKGSELSAEQIAELNLGDEIDADSVESAANYTVEYTEDSARSVYTSASGNKTYDIVIIKIADAYYYYIPVMSEGDAITSSYIAMVCDPKKYFNVTETSVAESVVSAQGVTVRTTITITTKIADGNAHYKMTTTQGNTTVDTEEFYIVAVNGELVVYMLGGGSWSEAGSAPYASIEELMEELFFEFDNSYFERTNSGFKMSSDKVNAYMRDVMSGVENIASIGLRINDCSADYYVENGRLSETVAKVSMSGTVSSMGQSVSMTATATATVTYTNFGTTTIELPFEV